MENTRSSRVTSRVLSLQQGESLDVHLKRGDSVSVLRGCVRVAGPVQWIGESLVQPAVEIREGEQHLCTERGELTLQALSACELWVLSATHAPIGQRVRDLWSRLAARGSAVRIA